VIGVFQQVGMRTTSGIQKQEEWVENNELLLMDRFFFVQRNKGTRERLLTDRTFILTRHYLRLMRNSHL